MIVIIVVQCFIKIIFFLVLNLFFFAGVGVVAFSFSDVSNML
jgi:hypothetical protein